MVRQTLSDKGPSHIIKDLSPEEFLEYLANLKDHEIRLADSAIMLAALEQSGISHNRYLHHVQILSQEVSEAHGMAMEGGHEDSLMLRLKSLKTVIADRHDYEGDVQTPEDIQNANLIRTIERSKGLSITLGLIYMQVAREQGWAIEGLDIPGHFVCRLAEGSERLIFDPFHGARTLEAHDLRQILKEALDDDDAELEASYYDAVSNRKILLSLQNVLKFGKIVAEDYLGALQVVEVMRKIDPEEVDLLLDEGVLSAKLNLARAAINALEAYLEKAPYSRDRYEAEALLGELRRNLN